MKERESELLRVGGGAEEKNLQPTPQGAWSLIWARSQDP